MTILQTDSVGLIGSVEGGKLKETGINHWYSPNTGATNESRLTALPGGWRNAFGIFYQLNSYCGFWTSSAYGTSMAWYRGLSYDRSIIYRDYRSNHEGLSIRLVKD
jgi:uncharacterized protein (TIGR02145 family)